MLAERNFALLVWTRPQRKAAKNSILHSKECLKGKNGKEEPSWEVQKLKGKYCLNFSSISSPFFSQKVPIILKIKKKLNTSLTHTYFTTEEVGP